MTPAELQAGFRQAGRALLAANEDAMCRQRFRIVMQGSALRRMGQDLLAGQRGSGLRLYVSGASAVSGRDGPRAAWRLARGRGGQGWMRRIWPAPAGAPKPWLET